MGKGPVTSRPPRRGGRDDDSAVRSLMRQSGGMPFSLALASHYVCAGLALLHAAPYQDVTIIT